LVVSCVPRRAENKKRSRDPRSLLAKTWRAPDLCGLRWPAVRDATPDGRQSNQPPTTLSRPSCSGVEPAIRGRRDAGASHTCAFPGRDDRDPGQADPESTGIKSIGRVSSESHPKCVIGGSRRGATGNVTTLDSAANLLGNKWRFDAFRCVTRGARFVSGRCVALLTE
jgi:hypothetical protein